MAQERKRNRQIATRSCSPHVEASGPRGLPPDKRKEEVEPMIDNETLIQVTRRLKLKKTKASATPMHIGFQAPHCYGKTLSH